MQIPGPQQGRGCWGRAAPGPRGSAQSAAGEAHACSSPQHWDLLRKPDLGFAPHAVGPRLTSSQDTSYCSVAAQASFAPVKPESPPPRRHCSDQFSVPSLFPRLAGPWLLAQAQRCKREGDPYSEGDSWTSAGRSQYSAHVPIPQVDHFLKLILCDSPEGPGRENPSCPTGMTSSILHPRFGFALLFLPSFPVP